MFERITDADIAKRGMSAVATTPTRKVAFGESDLTPAGFKERFDLLPKYLAERVNEIFDGISNGKLAASATVKYEKNTYTIGQFIELLLSGEVADINVKTIYETLSLAELGARVVKMYNGLSTGELASILKLSEKESLADFYKEAKAFVESDKEAIAELVAAKFTDVSEEGL